MAGFFRDVRYAVRRLSKDVGFTVAAVVTLALGIGANTAIFSVINAVLLRPLPFNDPDRIVAVWQENHALNLKNSPIAMGNYVDFRAQSKAFDQMGAVEARQFQLTGDADAEQVQGGLATSSLFAVLGVKPSLGRVFVEGEDCAGCAKVVVLSDSLWRGRYGADPQTVGKTVLINGEKYAVLGVMPEAFRFPNGDTELWTPVGSVYQSSEWSRRDRNNLMVVAHLKAGVSLTQADQEIQAIAGRLQREFPGTNPASVAPLREYFVGDVRPLLRILFGAVVFVLLIACANVANLLLSRSTRIRRQVAIARAIGASNFQIVKQMLIESCLLSVIGGVLGLVFALWSFGFVRYLMPTEIAKITVLSLDYRVLLFTLSISMFSGILFGVAPAAQLLRGDLANTLKESSTRMGVGPTTRRFRAILVCTEVALCFVLLIGAALLIQTFSRLRGVDLGFTTKDVLTAKIRLSPKYSSPTQRVAFYDGLLERTKARPGVVSVGLTTGVPLVVKGATTGISVDSQDGIALSAGSVNNRSVTSNYLKTIGVSLLRGRSILESDAPNSPPVALVNESLARKAWPGADPIGRRLKIGSPTSGNAWVTVIGLVRDIKQAGLDVPSKPEMYLPLAQQPERYIALAVRTRQNPITVASELRAIMRSLDSSLPLIDVATMDEILDKEVFQRRVQTLLLSAFASLALIMAVLGVYGVVSYLVEQSTHDIGVRVALGAKPGDVLNGVLRNGLKMSVSGIAIGGIAALGLTRYLANLLFGVGPRDLWTFVAVSVALIIVSVTASLVPALRASRIDPITALRYE